MNKHLPGVISIKYIEAALLPGNVIARCLSGTPVGIYNPATDIMFVGEPSCSASDNDGGASQTTTLEFQTIDEIPSHKALAFIVTDVNGASFLIGQKEGPYPLVNIERNTGIPGKDSNVSSVKVSFIAKKSLIPCDI